MNKLSALIGIAAAFTFGCGKQEDDIINPPMSDIPEITLMHISPTTVTALGDSIVFIIHYQDGNGDVGFNAPDSMSLYITDTRIPLTESFFVPLLSPEGVDISIQGELEVVLNNTILVDPDATSEEVQFEIQLRDRSGNYSNVLVTPAVTVFAE